MIERIAAANPTKSVIIAEDADAHAHVNSGMMIVRNDGAHHDVSVGFLRAALARGRLTREVVDVKSNDEERAMERTPSLSPPPAHPTPPPPPPPPPPSPPAVESPAVPSASANAAVASAVEGRLNGESSACIVGESRSSLSADAAAQGGVNARRGGACGWCAPGATGSRGGRAGAGERVVRSAVSPARRGPGPESRGRLPAFSFSPS